MLAVVEGGWYIIKRTMIPLTLPTAAPPPPFLTNTLLDGELIEPRAGGIDYVIFDALCVQGKDVKGLWLRDRLAAAKEFLKVVRQIGATLPFEFRMQNYFDLNRKSIEDVLSDMQQAPAVTPTLPSSHPRPLVISAEYSADGLTFIPAQRPYPLQFCPYAFKWKLVSTVDFLVRIDRRFESEIGSMIGFSLWLKDRGLVRVCDILEIEHTTVTAAGIKDDDILECTLAQSDTHPDVRGEGSTLKTYNLQTVQNSHQRGPSQSSEKSESSEGCQGSESNERKGGSVSAGQGQGAVVWRWCFLRKRTDKTTPNALWVYQKIVQGLVPLTDLLDHVTRVTSHPSTSCKFLKFQQY